MSPKNAPVKRDVNHTVLSGASSTRRAADYFSIQVGGRRATIIFREHAKIEDHHLTISKQIIVLLNSFLDQTIFFHTTFVAHPLIDMQLK